MASRHKTVKHTPSETLAYAYRSGHIGFAQKCPAGALPLLRGPDRPTHGLVSGHARLAYDSVTLLVPGVPEAESETAALDALTAFRDRLVLCAARRRSAV